MVAILSLLVVVVVVVVVVIVLVVVVVVVADAVVVASYCCCALSFTSTCGAKVMIVIQICWLIWVIGIIGTPACLENVLSFLGGEIVAVDAAVCCFSCCC